MAVEPKRGSSIVAVGETAHHKHASPAVHICSLAFRCCWRSADYRRDARVRQAPYLVRAHDQAAPTTGGTSHCAQAASLQHCLLPPASCLLPPACCLLPVASCLLPSLHALLANPCSALDTRHSTLATIWYTICHDEYESRTAAFATIIERGSSLARIAAGAAPKTCIRRKQ